VNVVNARGSRIRKRKKKRKERKESDSSQPQNRPQRPLGILPRRHPLPFSRADKNGIKKLKGEGVSRRLGGNNQAIDVVAINKQEGKGRTSHRPALQWTPSHQRSKSLQETRQSDEKGKGSSKKKSKKKKKEEVQRRPVLHHGVWCQR